MNKLFSIEEIAEQSDFIFLETSGILQFKNHLDPNLWPSMYNEECIRTLEYWIKTLNKDALESKFLMSEECKSELFQGQVSLNGDIPPEIFQNHQLRRKFIKSFKSRSNRIVKLKDSSIYDGIDNCMAGCIKSVNRELKKYMKDELSQQDIDYAISAFCLACDNRLAIICNDSGILELYSRFFLKKKYKSRQIKAFVHRDFEVFAKYNPYKSRFQNLTKLI